MQTIRIESDTSSSSRNWAGSRLCQRAFIISTLSVILIACGSNSNGNIGAATAAGATGTDSPVEINQVGAYPLSSINLTLSATNADEMYISNTPGCASDGSWEAYSTDRVWTLPDVEEETTVYVKFKGADGVESPCYSASVSIYSSPRLSSDSYGYHNCFTKNDGSLKCWSENDYGELGQGDIEDRGDEPGEMGVNLPAIDLGTGKTVLQHNTGEYHVCALLNDWSVKCWGYNGSAELGYGDFNDRGDEPGEMGDNLPAVDLGTGKTAIQITLTSGYSCAILNDGNVKCWGDNSDGQLGYGDTDTRGDDPGDMGDNLPVVDLGVGNTAVQIVSGSSGHTCARLQDNSVKCWGDNDKGQLGYGDTDTRGDGPGEMGDNLLAVDLGTGKTALHISAGRRFTCAVLNDASVKCWGDSANGRLGQGDDINSLGDAPGEMGDNLPAIDLGTGKTALKITAGGYHACAILNDNSLKCWGHNDNGQLGYGDIDTRGNEPGEMGDNLPAVDLGTAKTALGLSLGWSHTCAILNDETVKCWGYNGDGQLGQGDIDDRGDDPGEMGDNLPALDL